MLHQSCDFRLLYSMHLLSWLWEMCVSARPTIGIMAQQLSVHSRTSEFSSFIRTEYVKAVESAGARVMPIFINRTERYYRDTLQKINGILIPGGPTDFLEKGGMGQSTEIVISIAKKFNDANDHFPMLGVCWGFELFLYLSNKKNGLMAQCDCKNQSLSLKFKPKIKNRSKLLQNMPSSIYGTFTTPVTYNFHKWCVTEENFTANHLHEKWMILSTSYTQSTGKRPMKFVSAVESHKYPFVGLQFHPESTLFTWKKIAISHSRESILAARFFYDWLVDEATLSNHSFPSPEDEFKSLIWNYHPTFVETTSALPDSQHYLFK